ncbi:MAG: hypothetical protein WCC36_15515 [Gammaproteobacteria bacterium]
MSTLEQIRSGLGRERETLGDGGQQLYRRGTAHAERSVLGPAGGESARR